jgi:heme exporter protein A
MSAVPADYAVEVDGVARRYGRRWALANVTFRVPAATVLMISGRNGAGKSTLLRVLATAIKPDRGTVRIGGFHAVREREDVRRRTAILSHHNYLYESLTARENLAVVADHLRAGRGRIDAILGEVGLAARASDLVATFSAGMRKRLSFARILLQEPRVVLLDEPYGALDPAGFDLVDGFIRAFRERGATVLFATHQLERSVKLADASLVLEEGRVVA